MLYFRWQISLTVDNPQKVLLMGEAQDFGTCRGVKKNGEPCSQIVNTVRPLTSLPRLCGLHSKCGAASETRSFASVAV